MLRILKYLKPYWLMIVVATGLLYVQANLDLALPDYMSKIVNTGIQQGGVEQIIPDALGAESMGKLAFVMPKESYDAFKSAYTLVEPAAATGDQKSRYPLLEQKPVWIRNSGSPALGQSDEAILSKSLVGLAALNKYQSEQPPPTQEAAPDPAALQAQMAKMAEMKAQMKAKLDALDPATLKQMGISTLRTEYESLGMDMGHIQTLYLLRVGGEMLLITILSALAVIAVGYLAARTAAGVARNLRRDVFTRVEQFSLSEFDKFSTASLITRTTNDVTQVQLVIFMFLRMVVYAPIMGVGGVIRATSKAPSMAWIIGLAVLVLLVLIIVVMAMSMPKFRAIQKLVDRLNLVARENLGGLLVVRAFNRQKFEENRFDTANKDLTRVNIFVMRIMSIMMPAVMLIMNLLSIGIIWIGAHEIAASSMQVGDMMAFLQYAMQIVMSFLMLSMVMIFLPRAAVSGDRIADVLETEPVIKDPESPAELPARIHGRIEFKGVSFRYHGGEEDALSDISFVAEPGMTTAIIGSTGSGKSTLVNLIPRLYDASGGQVLLDGVDIRTLKQEDLRRHIGYVPQKNTLFSGDIRSNLAYGKPDATDEELMDAATTAMAGDFIAEREEGLDSSMAQGGTNVSGGQKQRLSIARALAAKSQILIFDDSFSALDFRTDADLRRNLGQKTGGATLIIVAQRVATIMNARQILVLDDGRIVGRGTHKELLKTCEAYREIARSQLGLEEEA